MRRFLIDIQFDGKRYSGFQKNVGQKTIQGEIEVALEKLFETKISTTGASRTDAGVSAKNFLLTFDCDTKLPADRVAFKLNRFLPKDIQCQSSVEVDFDFDLRKSIASKTYQYTIYTGSHIKPLVNHCAYFVEGELDLQNMQKCASVLIGKHNFKSFCNQNADTTSFEREIFDINIVKQEETIKLYFTANNFLFNMVRILAGTLVECGKNKLSADDIKDLLDKKDRSKNIAKTLPPKALILYKIDLK